MMTGKIFKQTGVVVGSAFALMFATAAHADPIGTTQNPCGNNTCNGGVYTLTYSGSPISNDGTNSVYRVTLTIDTTNLSTSPNPAAAVDAVAVKITSGAPGALAAASLFASPDGNPASWTTTANVGINAGGCSGAGGGFGCTSKSGGVAIATTMAWTFDLTIKNSVGLISPASIKVRYIDSAGAKTGDLVSENITLQTEENKPPVPEPSTVLLLCSGLAGFVYLRRQRS